MDKKKNVIATDLQTLSQTMLQKTDVPVVRASYYRWLHQQPTLLLGTLDEFNNVVKRTALMVPINHINEKNYYTMDDVVDKLNKMHYAGALYATGNNRIDDKQHYVLALAVSDPLTIDDQRLYPYMIRLILKQLTSQDLLLKRPRLKQDMWSQLDYYPVRNQFTDQPIVQLSGNAIDTDALRKTTQEYLLESAKPENQVTDSQILSQYLKTHSAKQIIADFVEYQQDWLLDSSHIHSCFLHLHAAVEQQQITSAEVPALIKLFANDTNNDGSQYTKLREQYDKMHGKFQSAKGLEYFVQADAIELETPWLSVSEHGAVSINIADYVENYKSTHQLIGHANLSRNLAIYSHSHWAFGLRAEQIIEKDIAEDLINVRLFTSHILNDCFKGIKVLSRLETDKPLPFMHANPHLVEFNNATYDISTDTFEPNNAKNYLRQYIPRSIKTTGFTKPELTLDWLNELVGKDKQALATLVRFIGYSFLSDYSHQVMLFLTGKGGNGKSYFLQYLRWLFDTSNVSGIRLEELTDNNNRFSAARLDGKFLNICADTASIHVQAIQRLKTLTGGDVIQVENKNETPYDLKVATKFIFAVNQLPALNDFTYGFFRRPRVINFPLSFDDQNSSAFVKDFQHRFPQDKIRAEADDFILYCLQQYWQAHQASPADTDVFPESVAMIETKENWINTSDSAGSFIRDFLEYNAEAANHNDGDPTKQIYDLYKYVTLENGAKPVTRKKLVNRIMSLNLNVKQTRNKRRKIQAVRLVGITLNTNAIEEIETIIGRVNMNWVKTTYRFSDWLNKSGQASNPVDSLAQ